MSPAHAPGLTAALARQVLRTDYDCLPEATTRAAKRSLLDGLGVMLAASGCCPEVRPFVQLARSAQGLAEADVLGCALRVPAPLAALANGAMAHALDFEDALDTAPLHPNASLIPALLALAQARAPVTGKQLLAALVAGCEVSCRLALSLRRPLEAGGWYPPPILGAFGAVAGCALLARLDAGQFADAFSLLLGQNSCPGQIKYSPESVIRAVREAFPAQAAVQCTLLAEAGIKGFAAPLEGEAGFYRLFADGQYDAAIVLADSPEHWHIQTLSFKRWPCCRGTHACVELALALAAMHGIRPADIGAIHILGGEVQAMLAEPVESKRRPVTAIDAKFSLPFTVATALCHGDVTLDAFTPQRLADPAVLALAARAQFQRVPEWDRRYATAGGLRIELADGRTVQARTEQALGHPQRPLDEAQLVAKFIDCAARAAAPPAASRAGRAARMVLELERLPDVRELLEGLTPA